LDILYGISPYSQQIFTSGAIVVCCSVGKLKTLTDRSRQTCAQFKKDKRANLSYNESQVHKYDKYVEYFRLAYKWYRGSCVRENVLFSYIVVVVNCVAHLLCLLLALASCLIYSYAFKEYISSFGCWSNGCVLFRDVTVSEIRRRKGALFLYSP